MSDFVILPSERGAFLDSACAGDAALLRGVESPPSAGQARTTIRFASWWLRHREENVGEGALERILWPSVRTRALLEAEGAQGRRLT